MQVFEEIMPLRTFLNKKKCQKLKIGLVPTMGALHKGHLKLVSESVNTCDLTVVSIFVNPMQFNDPSDFDNYPITLEKDLELLKNGGVDAVFVPSAQQMYPDKPSVNIGFGKLEEGMEGKFRPNHFNGVGLVVTKLFNIVNPDVAFFGQKDFQQLSLIKKINQDLNFGIEIIGVPTIREEDGLALSSRNQRLSEKERMVAPEIFKTLNLLKEELLSLKSVEQARKVAIDYIQQTKELKLEYLEIVDSSNLEAVSDINGHEQISLCIAAYLGDVRLIDNLYLFSR